MSEQDPKREQPLSRTPGGITVGTVMTLGAGMSLLPAWADAATFNVTNLNDGGAGSLRQAISDANAAPGADVITFQAGLTGTITLTTGQLAVTDSVDIQGPGAAVITVSGNNASRVFYLYASASTLDVSISGLTIANGSANIGAGLVNFDENLTLDGVTFANNHALADGGGLWADGFNMNLTITNSTFTGNVSGGDGGAIYVEDTGGPLLIKNCVLTGNQAAGSGGGIYFYDPDDDVTIEDTTISGNTAGAAGGGIYLYSPDAGIFTIRGTTISGNTAVAGGGLFFYSSDQGTVIENSTISGNTASGPGGGVYLYNLYGSFEIRSTTIAQNSGGNDGGGLFIKQGSPTLSNAIVAGNSASFGSDIAGSVTARYSLIQSPAGATVVDGTGIITGSAAQLGPLQDNGGPTQTHLPSSSSPAINAGDPAFAAPPSLDQRGSARVVNGRVDMGAVEVNPGTLTISAVTPNPVTEGGSAAVTVARTGGSDGTVSATLASSNGTAAAPADYGAINVTLTWNPSDSTSQQVTVATVAHAGLDPNRTFNVTLSGATGGAVLGSTSSTVTIQDDGVGAGGTLQFSAATASVSEGGHVTLSVDRTGGSTGTVTVNYATANGTAAAGSDYVAASGTLTWANGDVAPKSFTVSAMKDAVSDPGETFTVTLSNPTNASSLGSPQQVTVTITDVPAAIPTLSDAAKLALAALVALLGVGFTRREQV